MTPDWRAFALASALFAALTAILGKIGVREVNLRSCDIFPHRHHSTTERTHRERAPRQPLGALSRTSMIALGLSGVATGLSWLCYYRALQWGPASRVAPVDKLSGAFIIISIILIRNLRSKSHLRWVAHEIDGCVVFVVLIAAVFLHEPLTWKVGLGAAFITAGAVMMLV